MDGNINNEALMPEQKPKSGMLSSGVQLLCNTDRKNALPVGSSDYAFLLVAIAAVAVFIRFALFGGFNLGFTLSYFLLFFVSTGYVWKKGNRVTPFTALCGAFALLLSVPYALNNDGLIRFISFFAIIALTVLFLGGIANSLRCVDGSIMLCTDILRILLVYPISYIPVVKNSIKSDVSKGNGLGFKKIIGIVTGIAISVPLLGIIVPLLIRADSQFEELMDLLFGSLFTTLISIALSVFVLPFFYTGLFVLNKRDRSLTDDNALRQRAGKIGVTMLNTVLVLLSIVYVLYLVAQKSYFFDAFFGRASAEYSYSTYARSGFFEMCWVAGINLAVYFIVFLLAKPAENGKIPKLTRVLLSFLAVFTMLFISIAFSKMYLYIDNMGLTRLRVLTSLAMLLFFCVFLVLLIRLYCQKLQYMKISIIIAAVILTATAFADIDTQIARYNTNAYKTGKVAELDVETIGMLSDGAVPYLLDIFETGSAQQKVKAYEALSDYAYRQYEVDYSDNQIRLVIDESTELPKKTNDNSLLHYNYSRNKAIERLSPYAKDFTYAGW